MASRKISLINYRSTLSILKIVDKILTRKVPNVAAVSSHQLFSDRSFNFELHIDGQVAASYNATEFDYNEIPELTVALENPLPFTVGLIQEINFAIRNHLSKPKRVRKVKNLI